MLTSILDEIKSGNLSIKDGKRYSQFNDFFMSDSDMSALMHYGKPNTGLQLQTGMTFTIEPMINLGRKEVRLLGDGWTVVTKNHKLLAQWKHTILVTDSGY